MVGLRCDSSDIHLQPLLAHHPDADTYDPLFAAPAGCTSSARATVDTLNDVHRSWEKSKLFTVDTRLAGLPSPLSIVGTAKERKSPNPIANRLRKWFNYPPSAQQAQKRAYARLMRDGLLATIRYYAWDPHLFDVPTDADILTLSPGKIRFLTHATRDELFAQILHLECPSVLQKGASARLQLALHIGIESDTDAMQLASEECYIAFTKRRPFWRRVGEPLFCVPIVAVSAESARLFAISQKLASTFDQRGCARYERVGPGKFVLRTGDPLGL